MTKKLTTEDFVAKAKLVHGNNYDYSLVNYLNAKAKIKIICKEHGLFEMTPNNHLNGQNCQICSKINGGNLRRITHSDFVEKANNKHKNKYDYSLVYYITTDIKVKIVCSEHGVFTQIPEDHLSGNGCPMCKNSLLSSLKIKSIETFLAEAKKVHENKYDYSLVDYKGANYKIKIICNKHGVFNQSPSKHLNGQGCPICSESKGERKIREWLYDNKITFIKQHKFDDCKNSYKLPFDFYLPDYNMCVEYQGIQHFEPIKFFGGRDKFERQINNDFIKKEYCIKNNIKLILIKDFNEIKNLLKF